MTVHNASTIDDRMPLQDTDGVTSTVNYVRNAPQASERSLEHHTEDEARTTMVVTPGRPVTITNARPRRNTFSLDVHGFQLADHASSIPDLRPIEENADMAQVYRAEIHDLMLRVTGAARIIVRPGIKRRLGEAAVDELAGLSNARPARYVHADNSDSASEALVQRVLAQQTDITVADYSRYAIYNLWRCISPPPQDIPLAVCDARSIAPEDPVIVTALTVDSTYGDVRHDTLGFRYNPAHRWFYFRDMTAHEVLVFKQHDSDPTRPRRVPHSAFDDPGCPRVAWTRSSVEIRVIALFH